MCACLNAVNRDACRSACAGMRVSICLWNCNCRNAKGSGSNGLYTHRSDPGHLHHFGQTIEAFVLPEKGKRRACACLYMHVSISHSLTHTQAGTHSCCVVNATTEEAEPQPCVFAASHRTPTASACECAKERESASGYGYKRTGVESSQTVGLKDGV